MCSAKLPTTLLRPLKQSFVLKQVISKMFEYVPVSPYIPNPKTPGQIVVGNNPQYPCPQNDSM